jgi:hypothetical protein
MEHTNLIQNINKDLAIALPDEISFEELQLQMSAHINHLIKNNFEALITLLYRIDVSEDKLKNLLRSNPNEDAGNTIAALIIERQQQKITFKKQFTNKSSGSSNEEKW